MVVCGLMVVVVPSPVGMSIDRMVLFVVWLIWSVTVLGMPKRTSDKIMWTMADRRFWKESKTRKKSGVASVPPKTQKADDAWLTFARW